MTCASHMASISLMWEISFFCFYSQNTISTDFRWSTWKVVVVVDTQRVAGPNRWLYKEKAWLKLIVIITLILADWIVTNCRGIPLRRFIYDFLLLCFSFNSKWLFDWRLKKTEKKLKELKPNKKWPILNSVDTKRSLSWFTTVYLRCDVDRVCKSYARDLDCNDKMDGV